MTKNVEIVLIEDLLTDQELILFGFRKNNLYNKVHILQDGQEAVDFIDTFKREEFPMLKVIFLDLNLPKISGFEVLEKLKETEKTKGIPVVVLTSSASEKDIAQSYKLGANSYLIKPIDFQKFTSVMDILGFYWVFVNKT